MRELEVVREKIQNKYRVVKTDEDLEWNRAIDLCTNIINAHLSRENDPEIARSSRDNDGWISVEERLPERTLDEKINEEYKKYLVFIDSVDGWDVDIALYDFWNDKRWREAHDGYDEIENVIAWRPLPEPYRPERSET